jgi:FkbM family methyltransferase
MSLAKDFGAYLVRKARYGFLVKSNPREFTYCGVKLPLRATPQLQRIRRSVYRGDYERPEIEAIAALVRPDDVVLELGAGCGVVTTFIAKRLTGQGRIYTYEANPALLPTVSAVFEANGVSPTLTNAAVGLEDGETEFFFDADFLSSSQINRGKGVTPTTVQVVSFQRLLNEIRPTVVVFDVEGAEREILTGDFPASVRILCGELHPHLIGDAGVSNVVRNIMRQGFDLITDRSQGRGFAFTRPN